jgi:hypothetical protein
MEPLADAIIQGVEEYLKHDDMITMRGVVIETFEEENYIRHMVILTDQGQVSVFLRRKAYLFVQPLASVVVVGKLVRRDHIVAESIGLQRTHQLVDLFIYWNIFELPAFLFLSAMVYVFFPFELLLPFHLIRNELVLSCLVMLVGSIFLGYYVVFIRVPSPFTLTELQWDRLERLVDENIPIITEAENLEGFSMVKVKDQRSVLE